MAPIESVHTMVCPAEAQPAEPVALLAKVPPVKPAMEHSAILAALAPTHKFQHKPRLLQESNATSVSLAFAELASRLHFQEVADHLVTTFGQH